MSAYFCLPDIFPQKTSKESKVMKHLKTLSVHVLHIVAELFFGVVETRVLKKEACLHVSLFL